MILDRSRPMAKTIEMYLCGNSERAKESIAYFVGPHICFSGIVTNSKIAKL